VQYEDPGNDARGFGFTGVNGSRWMEATYSFSSPDEGIAGPGSSQPVRITLACPS
jgi:hypothetical protein